ncbi:MAG TPA: substrate-binding domain-containing protein [Acidimicrobiia bacterium]|nr:substrate-binding domain-containing protein [Acidimicrobiia bacterium]
MKLLNRRFLALLAVLVMVIAACGDGETTDTTAEGGTGTTTSGDDLVVGISWNNYAQPRWAKADGPAIIAAVEAAGGTVLEKDANDSSEQQLADVDALIAEGVDALIILAKDAEAILPAVQRAKDAGIPVIGYDRLIADSEAFYITFNNQGVGTIMAEIVTEAVPEGNYAIVKGHSADPNADFLREGMQAALDAHPGITIVCEDYNDNWDTQNARNMMDACLAANDNNLQAVISENDSMATGVVAALDAVGLAGTVPVTGQDGDLPALNRVALGTQLVSVWKDAFGLGQTAGEVAVQLAQGVALADVKAPSDLADHVAPAAGVDAQPFDADGVEVWSIILTPTPITLENINLVIDLGWEPQADVCAGVPAGTVEACG